MSTSEHRSGFDYRGGRWFESTAAHQLDRSRTGRHRNRSDRICVALTPPTSGHEGLPEASAIQQYSVIAGRRLQFDTLMWQVPALGLTAQAFLLNIALAHDSARLARAIAALLGMTTAALSMQLMAKHRANEVQDSRLLENLQQEHSLLPLHAKRGPVRNWFLQRSSFRIWLFGLGAFVVANFVIFGLDLVAPNLF